MNDFKEESIKLISINLKIHNANVLLRSTPSEPIRALEEIIEVMKMLVPLLSTILRKRLINGGIDNESISSLGDNETKTNDTKRS